MSKTQQPSISSAPSSKSVRTRASILDAALELMSTQGFEQTTMRAIAQHAGLVASAAYYYFKSKDELIMAFYERLLEKDAEVLPQIIATHKDFVSAFDAYTKHKFEQLKPHKSLIKYLVGRSMSDVESTASAFSKHSLASRAKAVGLMRELCDAFPLKSEKNWKEITPLVYWIVLQVGTFIFANEASAEQAQQKTLGIARWTKDALEVGILPMPIDFKSQILSAFGLLGNKLELENILFKSDSL